MIKRVVEGCAKMRCYTLGGRSREEGGGGLEVSGTEIITLMADKGMVSTEVTDFVGTRVVTVCPSGILI